MTNYLLVYIEVKIIMELILTFTYSYSYASSDESILWCCSSYFFGLRSSSISSIFRFIMPKRYFAVLNFFHLNILFLHFCHYVLINLSYVCKILFVRNNESYINKFYDTYIQQIYCINLKSLKANSH